MPGAAPPDPHPVIVRVQPLTTTRAVRGWFDYRLAAEHDGVGVGSLLRIPFGGGRPLGVVVEVGSESEMPLERLSEPLAVLPGSLPPDLVTLARWMAGEYCSTVARALGVMLAPGARHEPVPREVLVAVLTEAGRLELESPGFVDEGGRALSDRQRMVLEKVWREGPVIAAEVGTPALRRLGARGLVSLTRERVAARRARTPAGELWRFGSQERNQNAKLPEPVLNRDQERALAAVLEALGPGRAPDVGGAFLLHGVTGSGKTEVYLRAVRAVLEAGKGAIVLVPEIALTPQTVGRFRERFGDIVAVQHSALSGGERHAQWLSLRNGTARVCVGPRSAIFAPIDDLGLIVIDEEHDGSYKHEGDPRYDARTLAHARAAHHGAVVLAGSATPRPESVATMRRLVLSGRIAGRPLPPVRLLDMRGHHHPLHPETRMALSDVRRAGQKAIVLLNRRGWSNFLSCRACGHVWMCPNCDVALVLHQAQGLLACHHCGHRAGVPSRCPACASVAVARHGAGTQRIEHDLREALGDPEFPVFRLDADAVARKDQMGRTLARFGEARAGILVGTQMVAKGHDFERVTLGVVLDADQTLRFPDFRAEERTFALVTQLAGRAGRGEEGGRVLVQTLAPDARALRFAAHHDSEGFVSDELVRRQALGYPPFTTLVRIVCSAPDAPGARAVAAQIKAGITGPGSTVLGPAPLFRLRARARSQVVVKATDRRTAIDQVGAAVDGTADAASRAGVSISVDVDPQ